MAVASFTPTIILHNPHARAHTQTPDAGKAAELAAALEDRESNGYANMDVYIGVSGRGLERSGLTTGDGW